MLARSRGCVVPSFVPLFHVFVPVFFKTIVASTRSPHFTCIGGIDASGHDWLTYDAPYAMLPYAFSTAFRVVHAASSTRTARRSRTSP